MEVNPQAIDLDSNESLSLDVRRNWSSKVESLKRMAKFVVSVCVFCLGVTLFLSVFSVFPHSLSVYFSTFLFSLLNHAMERKYMFLICNGILFLIATCSVIQDSSSSSSSFGTCSFSHYDDDHFEQSLVAAIDGSDSEEEFEEQNQKREEEEEEISGVELEEDVDDDEEDEGCFTDEVEEEEEGKGRELEVVVSTEELNKKIEEFIRKMKEEMRIEAAQTHLIAV